MNKRTIVTIISIIILTALSSYAQRELPLPEIPTNLETRDQKMRYLLTHFWDAMNWDDPKLDDDPLYLEQNLSNYFSVMALADSAQNACGVKELFKGAAHNHNVSESIAQLAESYLYNPTSPYYNAESYLVFSDYLRTDEKADEATRSRAEYSRSQILKNRLDTKATDFNFLDRDGNVRSLYTLADSSQLNILIFYDTDCRDCHQLQRQLSLDGDITRLIADNKIRIIAIDAFGATHDHWLQDAITWPMEWIVGWNPEGEIDAGEVYALRTTPSVYILDSEMKVLAKDLRNEEIKESVLKYGL